MFDFNKGVKYVFWDIFVNLCTNAGKSTTAVILELGLSRSSVTTWKKGTVPNNSSLVKIANYFNVSVNYLLGKEKESAPTPTRSECEEKIIERFRTLPEEEQEAFLKIIEAMSKSSDKP